MVSQEAPDPFRAFARGYRHSIPPDASDSLSLWLNQTLASARARWPQVELTGEVFSHKLGEMLANDGSEPPLAMALHAVDLFLTFGCVLKVVHAADTFDREYLVDIGASLRRIDASQAFAEDVRQGLREKLLVADKDEIPRIARYSGRGPLSNWVAVAAQREALTLKRADSRRQRVAEQHAESLFPNARDPELVYMRARYRVEFQEAFRVAVGALPDRDRVVLRFSLIDKVSLTKIGAIYGVNQSTVTRWIARAREQVIERMLQFFREHLGLGRDEFESVARLIQSEIDLNVSKLLTEVVEESQPRK